MLKDKQTLRIEALEKELRILYRKEAHLLQAAKKRRETISWKTNVEKKIPEKIHRGLESAFAKAFAIIFEKGRVVIEKSYDKNALQEDHAVRDFAFRTKGGRKELHDMKKSASRASLGNMALTTVEGVGLGVLGIGMPDMVLFIGMLLKGIYETAIGFGYDYASSYEQLIILKMMAASLSEEDDFVRKNDEVDALISAIGGDITKEELDAQIKETASVFAMDMLLLKFIQGLPIVGIIGGAANPVYYHKILRYAQLKYQKRFLEKLLWEERTGIRLD